MDKNTTIEELKILVQQFIDSRDWQQFHNPKDLAISISLEAAELLELFQWQQNPVMTAQIQRKQIRYELADIVIYCLSFASTCNIDITAAIKSKMKINDNKYPIKEYYGKTSATM